MSIKTPAEQASQDYCDTHGLYFERFCPDCRLEEWDMFNGPTETGNVEWVSLKEV